MGASTAAMLRKVGPVLGVLSALVACGGGENGPEPQAPMIESRLAAVRLIPGNPPRLALVTMREDGSDVRLVLEAPTADGAMLRVSSPSWTPDGRRMMFTAVTAEREGRVGDEGTFTYYETDVFSIEPDGNGPRTTDRNRRRERRRRVSGRQDGAVRAGRAPRPLSADERPLVDER